MEFEWNSSKTTEKVYIIPSIIMESSVQVLTIYIFYTDID